jgi:endonuclease/exonuclease/phosphatase family metal-dependent hydrolase
MTTLRVVTWNIAAGRKGSDPRPGVSALDAIAGTLRGLDADLVALQEVDRGIGRSGRVDQPRLLGDALEMTCWFAPAIRSSGPDGPWAPLAAPGRDTGDQSVYGIALLSRLPLEDVEPCPLPPGPSAYLGHEQRVALAAAVRAGGHALTVAATHLDRHPERAAPQLRYLQEWLAGRPAPRMLIGDLNLRPSRVAAVMPPGWRRAVKGRTHPATLPVRQIDHVLLDSPALRVRSAQVVATRASDHRAVLVELELPA